ncbi:hypothetical protein PVAND_010903 [Polypedilum vanderplanki]|uniref:Golgi SNAP receptor complex member 2 n=1 Tax=Polypedilum vanderplanki TaxID=319348 RepID=A0A9J6CHX3_POLVA|nr:hypothetical protein PVAND_010903 [Polypedilum vanderplanki]
MDALYHSTNKIIHEIQQCFQQLNNPGVDSIAVENEIMTKINTVNANCDRLDVLVFKVPAATRQNSKMKVDQLKYDIRHLQTALSMYQQKRQKREMEATEREQLLTRRFQPNSETTIDLDYSLQHNTQMQNAHRGVDEMLSTGNNIINSLRNQRDILKGARTRMLNVGSTLGLSDHTIRLIERRLTDDRYVMFAGMFVTLCIIGLVIYLLA